MPCCTPAALQVWPHPTAPGLPCVPAATAAGAGRNTWPLHLSYRFTWIQTVHTQL